MIKASNDSKTRAYKGQKNTFGTLPGPVGGTCPSATTGEGGCWKVEDKRVLPNCYVCKLTNARPNVKKVLQYNTDELIRKTYEEQLQLFREEFERFQKVEERRGNEWDLNYRIHWSGDIPDHQYACALAQAMTEFPKIKFWGYTRSLFSVSVMAGLPNVRWYISADAANLEESLALFRKYLEHPVIHNINFCYMGKEPLDLPDIRLFTCPVDIDKMPLPGACQGPCRACLEGADVFFKLR